MHKKLCNLWTCGNILSLFLSAIRAEAFYEIFDFVQFIAVGTGYRRDMDCVQAESFVTGFTIEMAVHFVRAAVVDLSVPSFHHRSQTRDGVERANCNMAYGIVRQFVNIVEFSEIFQ